MDLIVEILFVVSTFLVFYHHLFYPILLKALASRKSAQSVLILKRHYQDQTFDDQLPAISVVIPCHNEGRVIADKILNLASLDYPASKLEIRIYFDGCTDDSLEIAKQTLTLPECLHLQITLINQANWQGKIAMINRGVGECQYPLVLLTDTAALLSVDSLLLVASYFNAFPRLGVLAAKYALCTTYDSGENRYWQYQTAVKKYEADLGGLVGAHGAGYVFRKSLFQALPLDCINDDVILPTDIITQGYKAIYEPNFSAVELEDSVPQVDYARRKRLGAGNMQQLISLRRLLSGKYNALSFTFISGKALRVMMPWCLILIFLTSVILSRNHKFFQFLALLQIFAYAIAGIRHRYQSSSAPKIIECWYYFVIGYLASLIGGIDYLRGRNRKPWKKV